MDQPTRWYHAMQVIAGAVAQCERERLEEMEAEAQAGGASHGRSRRWDQWAAGG
jgi:hypothetical protein